MDATHLIQTVLDNLDDTTDSGKVRQEFTRKRVCDMDYNNFHIVVYTDFHKAPYVDLRIVAPLTHPQVSELRDLAYEVATCVLSESTNHDACDVTVRERSAHIHLHDDIGFDGNYIVIDVEVNDYLS